MTKQREQAEMLIYNTFDKADKTHSNSDYYRSLFAKMSDEDFIKFCKRRLPFRFHTEVFKIEPTMADIIDAFKVLNKPLFERVKLPYIYKDKNGVPVESQECLVIYEHIKRMKQMLTKKNNTALNIDSRDMKTGLLTGSDKGGKETDREFESLAVMGLEYTMDEFARPKADAMGAKAQMSNIILNQGHVSAKDLDIAKDDSLAKNLINVYFTAAHLHTNIVDIDYMTPYTARNKQQKIVRQ